MSDKTKIEIRVSIAGTVDGDPNWSAQPGDIVEIDSATATKWVASKLAVRAAKDAPLTSQNNLLLDLTAEECLRRNCTHCQRRAKFVLRNKPYCPGHFRAELES